MNVDANKINHDNYRVNDEKTKVIKSFEYKTKMIGYPSTNNKILKTHFAVPLKYLSYF